MKLTRRSLLANTAAAYAAGQLAAGASPEDAEWIGGVFRELHIDAHFGQLPSPYVDFDPEPSAQMLAAAGFQMVSIFASCGAGYSYYPTSIGVVHPGLKRDFTGEICTSLKKRGIRILAYVAVGVDRRYHQDHPDWLIVRDPAKPVSPPPGDSAQMCINSPWVETVHIPQLREIVSRYDVDGFFLDSLLGKFTRGPCYCSACRKAFAAEVGGEIPASDHDPNVFALHKWLTVKIERYAEKVIPALLEKKGSLAFALNHVWVSRNPVKPPSVVRQLVWEPAPPYPGVLSLDMSFEARYLSTQRTIDNWSCMATRGNAWGDYSLRDPEAFEHEAAVLLASGGRPYLSDDSYPSGNPDPAVYELYAGVNRQTVKLQPFVTRSVPIKDTAVLLSADSIWSKLPLTPPRDWWNGPSSHGTGGAHKALVEEHVQFSILNSSDLMDDLESYRALVLPEQCVLSDKECDAIRRFVNGGGALLVTSDTGTRDSRNAPRLDFALADVLGIRLLEHASAKRAFLRVRPAIPQFGIPGMDVQVAGDYCRIQVHAARTLFDLVPATGPKQAPAPSPEGPGMTINDFGKGKTIYCALPLFSAYSLQGTAVLRKLVAWMLQEVHPLSARCIVLKSAPLNVEFTYNALGNARFVHLINYTGDKRSNGAQRLQAFSPVHGIQVRLSGRDVPKQILSLPGYKPVAFEYADGWTSFHAEPLSVHSVYRIED